MTEKGTTHRSRRSTRPSWRRSTRPPRRSSPRLLAQIANEAAFALEEEVGSPEDMGTAMRLGFNWPRGPLELTELIGRERAARLQSELRAEHGDAYAPAPSLATAR